MKLFLALAMFSISLLAAAKQYTFQARFGSGFTGSKGVAKESCEAQRKDLEMALARAYFNHNLPGDAVVKAQVMTEDLGYVVTYRGCEFVISYEPENIVFSTWKTASSLGYKAKSRPALDFQKKKILEQLKKDPNNVYTHVYRNNTWETGFKKYRFKTLKIAVTQ